MSDPTSAPFSASTEQVDPVQRPPPGLARGLWELPAGAFYAAGAALVLASALYGVRRFTRKAAR